MKQLTFLINRNNFMCKKIKQIIQHTKSDIQRLLGEVRIIVAERKNCNIASNVFGKSSFSKTIVEPGENQKCNKRGCKSCKIMNLPRRVTAWKNNEQYEKHIKLDHTCDCSTECIIYIYICNLCKNNESFYIGQSVNSCQSRANGHRANFSTLNYKKSALSHHIYKDHPEHTAEKLANYSLGVIKTCRATALDRSEDYYVEYLNANLSLNRYKVIS